MPRRTRVLRWWIFVSGKRKGKSKKLSALVFQLCALFAIFEPMLTLTTHTLEKLELLLKTAGYKVRYEKGNFKTGACLLLNSKVIVVNRFSNLESKIAGLAELLQTLDIDQNLLDDKQTAYLYQLKQTKLQL
jgi:hypothetical protein